MKKRILTVLMLLITSNYGFAESSSLQMTNILAVSKFTGACGVFGSLVDFQKKTQMLNGDEFITRFLKTEAARLGKTDKQFVSDCSNYIDTYNMMWKVANEAESKK